MSKIKLVLATQNGGKIAELKRLAALYDVQVVNEQYPSLASLNVEETGSSFYENSLLKLKAAQALVNDRSVYIVADDSGLEIPMLNNEPGVYTRRWAGYEMSDQEIIDYCLKKMSHLHSDDRKATFKTVLAVGRAGDYDVSYYTGELTGLILTEPKPSVTELEGFPFRALFYLPDQDKMIYEIQDLSGTTSFKTHREKAFAKMLQALRRRK